MAQRIYGSISDDLWQAKEIIRRENHYANDPAFLRGLIRYACAKRVPHLLSQQWATLAPDEADILDRRILAAMDEPLAGGDYLTQLVVQVVRAMFPPGVPAPTVPQVLRALVDCAGRRPM